MCLPYFKKQFIESRFKYQHTIINQITLSWYILFEMCATKYSLENLKNIVGNFLTEKMPQAYCMFVQKRC